jgi:hypothetical protein
VKRRSHKEAFTISLLGGAVERNYRRVRPAVEKLPWSTLDASRIEPELLARAREYYTHDAHNEYYSAACVAQVVGSLIAAQTPLDMVAMAAGFIVDELSHAEMAARVVVELGGAVPIEFDSSPPLPPPDPSHRALLAAACRVVDTFCIGESLALPLAQESAKLKAPKLIDAMAKQVARDEAAHGSFGWVFFDWALDLLSPSEKRIVRQTAEQRLGDVREMMSAALDSDDDEPTLGWLGSTAMARLGKQYLESDVIAPLRARGLLGKRF